MIRAGARGFITKRELPGKILLAIRKVLSGEIYWSENAAARVASKVARSPRSNANFSVDGLTDREVQVFELLGTGQSTHQIADTLHLSRVRVSEAYFSGMEKVIFS